MAFKRPEILRRIQGRPEHNAEAIADALRASRARQALQRMIETEGWKIFQAKMQERSSEIVARLQSPSTKDEDVLPLRHQLVGINMVQHVLTKMIAEGDNAEKQLKTMQDETEEVHA